MAHILREDVYKILDELPKERFLGGNRDLIYLEEARAEIERLPTADVVPKSEVERLQAELDNKQFRCDSCDRIMLTGAEHRACVKQAKSEVAREIFEEIEEQIDRGLSVITKILNAKGGRSNGKTVLISKYDVYIEAKKYIAKLKKKYTEESDN